MPPIRKVRPTGASLAATCDGVKKNTRFWLNAVKTRAVATPSATTPSAIHAIRLCLGFTLPLHQQNDFDRQQGECDAVGTPDVEPIPAHGKELAHAFCPPDKGGGAKRRGVFCEKNKPPARFARDPLIRGSAKETNHIIRSPRSRSARARAPPRCCTSRRRAPSESCR